MSLVHPTAIISDKAKVHPEAQIGPYAVIVGEVTIGKGTIVDHHASIGCEQGITEIGENNHFSPSCVVGAPPQDLSYKNEKTKLIIGNNNTIREFATLNNGTAKDNGVTQIGDNNLLMAYIHIAHDCIIGNNNVIANSTQFAGHITVEDNIVISGGCLINQFTKIGRGAYVTGDSSVNKDVPPFTIVQGKYAVMRACNKVGLERSGMDKSEVDNIYKAVRILIKGKNTLEDSIEKIKSECEQTDNIKYFLNFIQSSERGLAF